MAGKCQSLELDAKCLLGQLNTARKEINNLRQQIRNLRYVHEKDVESIKRLLESYTSEKQNSREGSSLSKTAEPSTSNEVDPSLKLKPIGIASTWFPSKRGTPRQPGVCDTAPAKLTLFQSVFTNPAHALEGLEDFSHMWILFHFHRNDSTHVRAKVAPPRLNGARTGVFSTRSPHRPCPIGLSLVKIIKIENNSIFFEGVDMVDQTPVLDIKPYIPQYDNPSYFDKTKNREVENGSLSNRELLENIEQRIRNSSTFNSDVNERLSIPNVGSGVGHAMRGTSRESYIDSTDGAAPSTDISRDEEIALRLQAEEFERNSNFENYLESRNHFRLTERHLDSCTVENARHGIRHAGALDSSRDLSNGTNTDPSMYREREITNAETYVQNSIDGVRLANIPDSTFTGRRNPEIATRPVESPHNAVFNIQHDDVNSRSNSPMMYGPRNPESNNHVGEPISRSTRSLDGADGPITYIDLNHRRATNPRLDNSPVRMGIREAPDGEEGFASQNLTPSQTLSNIQTVTTSNILQNITTSPNVRTETRAHQNYRPEDHSADVRIPDWISRPRVSALTVTFNERALVQLNEILGDKADQQRQAIENVLCEDPRSVYLRQRWANQFYTFLIHELHISCRFDDNRHIVTVFQIRHAGRMCECGEPEWQCLGHSPLA